MLTTKKDECIDVPVNVMDLLIKDRGDMSIPAYAKVLELEYRNLWAVFEASRQLPLPQVVILCQRQGLSCLDVIRLYLAQESIPHQAKKPPRIKKSLLTEVGER
jgi:hypothetical protein